jgi:hypothetical protein
LDDYPESYDNIPARILIKFNVKYAFMVKDINKIPPPPTPKLEFSWLLRTVHHVMALIFFLKNTSTRPLVWYQCGVATIKLMGLMLTFYSSCKPQAAKAIAACIIAIIQAVNCNAYIATYANALLLYARYITAKSCGS